MAADTLGVMGDVRRVCHKLHRVGDAIIGFAGSYADGLTFVEWWRDGCDLGKTPEFKIYRGTDDAPDVSALVLTAAGVSLWTEHFQPTPVVEPFFAIGNGVPAALAAMHMGADAPEAVRIASLVFTSTNDEIQSLSLDETAAAIRKTSKRFAGALENLAG